MPGHYKCTQLNWRENASVQVVVLVSDSSLSYPIKKNICETLKRFVLMLNMSKNMSFSIWWGDPHSVFEYIWIEPTYITLPPLIQEWILNGPIFEYFQSPIPMSPHFANQILRQYFALLENQVTSLEKLTKTSMIRKSQKSS